MVPILVGALIHYFRYVKAAANTKWLPPTACGIGFVVVIISSSMAYSRITQLTGEYPTHFLHTLSLLTLALAASIWVLLFSALLCIISFALMMYSIIKEYIKRIRQVYQHNHQKEQAGLIGYLIRQWKELHNVLLILSFLFSAVLLINTVEPLIESIYNNNVVGYLLYHSDYFPNSYCESHASNKRVAILGKNLISIATKKNGRYVFQTGRCDKPGAIVI